LLNIYLTLQMENRTVIDISAILFSIAITAMGPLKLKLHNSINTRR
jgi:hypothetical protein